MPKYYFRKTLDAAGNYHIHWSGRIHNPDTSVRLLLGEYPNNRKAVQAAKSLYSRPYGCPACTPECHR